VKNVADVVKVGETIQCRVLSVDVAGKRLALTRKGMGFGGRPASASQAREEEEDGERACFYSGSDGMVGRCSSSSSSMLSSCVGAEAECVGFGNGN
jgi:transcriptional accessory protein Tex/SPT6